MWRKLSWILLGCLVLPVLASDDSRSGQGNDKQTAQPSKDGKGTKETKENKESKDATATSKSAKQKGAATAKASVITPEREAAAMTFVKQHHPELAELLIHLKESSSKEYERAIRDLFRTSERLAQVQERDVPVYELELKLWKARSRAQLLSARLQMADSEELRGNLRSTLEEEYDAQLQLLQRERDRLAERVNGLNSQIDRLTQRRSDAINNQFQKLTKSAGRADVKAKTNVKKKAATAESVK